MTGRFFIVITVFFVFIAVLPQLATHNSISAESGNELQAPSPAHWLGTDHLGRDLWSRLVTGGQRTLAAALLATCLAVGGGLIFSGLHQYSLTTVPASILLDALLAFPTLLIALVVRTLLAGSWFTLALAIGLAGIPLFARVAVDALRIARTAPHIEGAYSIGASQWRVFTHHLIPTAMPALASFGAVLFGWMILYQATLSFLGLGGNIVQPDWGLMLSQGRSYLEQAPLLIVCPGGMIALNIWLASLLAEDLARHQR